MYKFLILILFLFAGCGVKPETTTIQNLRAVTTTTQDKSITEYFGDYIYESGANCCSDCAVTNHVAEQVLKNPLFTVGCVGENVTTSAFMVGGIIALFGVCVVIVIKDGRLF
jgi:hypothetical protein